MKTKLFLAAVAVTFSFAMTSCTGNKTANSEVAADSTAVEAAATCCKSDSVTCCKGDSATCDKSKAACDSTKKECCKGKAACDKK